MGRNSLWDKRVALPALPTTVYAFGTAYAPLTILSIRTNTVAPAVVMSNQYAYIYQQQQPQLHTSPAADEYQPQPGSQSLRSSPVYAQLDHAQPFPPPVSPIPLHYLAHTQQVHHFSSQLASNQQPIPAPSPQYPQQLTGAPHVSYSSPPTSPISNGLPRRPLPTPGPTPVPTSPLSHPRSLRPGSLPSSGVTVPSPQLTSTFASPSPTSPTSGRRPLPLPRAVPGISSDTGTRSSSPAKDVVKPSPSSPVGSPSLPYDAFSSSPSRTKFIPYWKRSLPDPSSDRVGSASSSQEAINSGPSGSSSSVSSPGGIEQPRNRTKSFTSGRPLPPSPLDGTAGKPPFIPPTISVLGEGARVVLNPSSSPVRATTLSPSSIKLAKSSSSLPSTAGSSGLFSIRPISPTKGPVPSRPISPASSGDDGKSSQNGKAPQKDRRSPSPQYGILDLPLKSRSVISRNNTKHSRAPASIDQNQTDEPHRGRSSTL